MDKEDEIGVTRRQDLQN